MTKATLSRGLLVSYTSSAVLFHKSRHSEQFGGFFWSAIMTRATLSKGSWVSNTSSAILFHKCGALHGLVS